MQTHVFGDNLHSQRVQYQTHARHEEALGDRTPVLDIAAKFAS